MYVNPSKVNKVLWSYLSKKWNKNIFAISDLSASKRNGNRNTDKCSTSKTDPLLLDHEGEHSSETVFPAPNIFSCLNPVHANSGQRGKNIPNAGNSGTSMGNSGEELFQRFCLATGASQPLQQHGPVNTYNNMTNLLYSATPFINQCKKKMNDNRNDLANTPISHFILLQKTLKFFVDSL